MMAAGRGGVSDDQIAESEGWRRGEGSVGFVGVGRRDVGRRGCPALRGVTCSGAQVEVPVPAGRVGSDAGGAQRRPPRCWQSRAAAVAAGEQGIEDGAGRGHGAVANLAARSGAGRPNPFTDLEALRAAAGLPVSRFVALTGIPERTYRRRLARLRVGDPAKGPWPAPVVDRFEALAAKYAEAWPAWGYRKIAALMRADGHDVSNSSVQRALRRRGLLLPQGFRADRKSWAALRRKVFRGLPTERNRVWQTDFSAFETTNGGIWRICAVIDYVTKYCLAITVTPTSRGIDALHCLQLAVTEAQRLLGLDDLRADRGVMDILDANDTIIGQAPAPIAVVSDNGPCYRGATFKTLFVDDDPLLRHVRTRIKSPQTNGVVERFFESLKYEHLFRGYIGDGDALDMEVHRFRIIYNTIRPHQALDYRTPKQAYQHPPTHENLPKT